jgi:3alpha(or 20beta)-hydroxysteroid dehydrogenase
MSELAGRVAIVTGAARGTGAAIARRFAVAGARLVLTDVQHELGEKVAGEIGGDARYQPLDVTREADWGQAVEATLAAYGRIDVLVNNAAILHMGALANTSAETLRRVLDVNTVGPFLGIRAVAEPMRAQGGGAIVNVGSIDSLLGMNGISAYAASKWGLRGLSKSLALELGRDGIRINSVCPAGGSPEMYGPWMPRMASFSADVQAYQANRAMPGPVPLEVIAEAALYLASDASRGCAGIDLAVDGGATAGRFVPGFNTL